jgi:hypothetical protein
MPPFRPMGPPQPEPYWGAPPPMQPWGPPPYYGPPGWPPAPPGPGPFQWSVPFGSCPPVPPHAPMPLGPRRFPRDF